MKMLTNVMQGRVNSLQAVSSWIRLFSHAQLAVSTARITRFALAAATGDAQFVAAQVWTFDRHIEAIEHVRAEDSEKCARKLDSEGDAR